MTPTILITGSSGFIGANAVNHFKDRGWIVFGTDLVPPKRSSHQDNFLQCDLLSQPSLIDTFRKAAPDFVLHLGAVTDTFTHSKLPEYAANMDGMRNVISAANACKQLKRIIITSSRLVCRIGFEPKTEEDYDPPNAYGQSKVETERITRSSTIRAEWLLTRPTAIWGPGFTVPSYRDFFEHIRRGRYFHIGRTNPKKTFGYVNNFTFQMERLLLAPRQEVHGRVFYVGDYQPVKLRDWAEQIGREFGVRRIPSVPLPFVKAGALAGDLLRIAGMRNPPLTSYRLANLLYESVHDTAPLERITGALPHTLEAATRETTAWIKQNP